MADGPPPGASSEALEVLMESYLDGDLAAFDRLYALTAPRVFRFLCVMTGDRSRAEDLSQIAFLKMHKGRAGWLRGSPVMPWLMAITRNAFFDEARARAKQLATPTRSGEVPDVPGAPGAHEGLGEESDEQRAARLRRLIDATLATVAPGRREAFVLTKISGLSVREAAQLLGTSEMGVKLRVHRVYERLRAALQEQNQGDDAWIGKMQD